MRVIDRLLVGSVPSGPDTHAEIVRDATGAYAIKDMEFLNGVLVDNKKVQWVALSEGAQIDIRDLRPKFSTEGGTPTESRAEAR